MAHFDLAIIGTGSGNALVTSDFDGKRVALIESGTFGGTCLNVGCIPTKMYVYSADVANTITHAPTAGLRSPPTSSSSRRGSPDGSRRGP